MMYLITGATGHIGNTLIRTLLEANPQAKIRAMVLPNTDDGHIKDLPIEIVYGNVLDTDSLDAAMQDVEVVFHLAAMISIRSGQEDLIKQVNIQGAENVGRAALKAGVRRMVHVGSIHIFERIPTGVIDENVPLVTKDNAAGIYDDTKAEAVRRIQGLVNEGLDVVIACPTGVLGPNDYLGSEIGQVIRNYMAKSTHVILKGGYDWVDVRDVAQGLIQAAERGSTGDIYLLSGTYISLESFINHVGEVLNKSFRVSYAPYPIVFVMAHVMNFISQIFKTTPQLTPYALRTIRDNANISHQKATDALAYVSRPLDETFRDTIEWYKTHPSQD